jgi:type II restriction enzyme
MRERVIEFNTMHRKWLSNDLGAVAGFLFDIGSGRYSIGATNAVSVDWEADLAKVHEESAAAHKARVAASENDQSHTQIQGWLRDLGTSWAFMFGLQATIRVDRMEMGALATGV